MPWPKGKPIPPEQRAKLSESARAMHAQMPPEQRALIDARMSVAHQRRMAENPDERARIGAIGRATLEKYRVRAAEEEVAHLTDEQRAMYRDLRKKKFTRRVAMALVETGRLP